MKNIKEILLEFFEDDGDKNTQNDNFAKLIQHIADQEIHEKILLLKEFFNLLSKILKNHHRSSTFFQKIEPILKEYVEDIKKFSNIEIFNFFKCDKRILLFLIEEKILILDKTIAYIMTNPNYLKKLYPHYFFNEIKPFLTESLIEMKTTQTHFYIKENKVKMTLLFVR